MISPIEVAKNKFKNFNIYNPSKSDFQITPKAIIIYFNPNEIIPFKHGIQKIILPFDQIPTSQTLLKALKPYE